MNKTVHFVSGLPRAGANLLCNILAQNPRFDVTPTSGIIDIVLMVRNRWNRVVEFQAAPDEPAKLRVMRSVMDGYFENGKDLPEIQSSTSLRVYSSPFMNSFAFKLVH